ncbi:MAG: AmmeMemoRadiSam system protein B [Deltaproteobacteria bacterium]|nr:MAG: AmmeMemoRadiSam system protein B [Deltaproteobacteria bacterium]
MEKKQAVFAGTWYPGTARECEIAIQQFLREGKGKLQGDFIGGIVPHAGWHFSGSIAARVIASLKPPEANVKGLEPDKPDTDKLDADKLATIDTIFLFGAHMHPQSEPFIMTRGRIETPFGEMEVDGELVEKIAVTVDIQRRSPEKFPDENTLELQYPFIKYFFPRAKIVVAGVPPSPIAATIGAMAVAEAKSLGRRIRIIGSTDMTHYGPDFGFTPAGLGEKAVEWVATENDKNALAAMEQMDTDKIIAQGIDHKNMCCAGAAAAAIAACKKKGAVKAIVLDYATSFERSRSDSFVGYAGLVYSRA